MTKTLSPCIKTCKFKRPGPAGLHCIGCSMTKTQKAISKGLKKGSAKRAMADFVALVQAQQRVMGRYSHWRGAYLRRCLKKGAQVPKAVRKAG